MKEDSTYNIDQLFIWIMVVVFYSCKLIGIIEYSWLYIAAPAAVVFVARLFLVLLTDALDWMTAKLADLVNKIRDKKDGARN